MKCIQHQPEKLCKRHERIGAIQEILKTLGFERTFRNAPFGDTLNQSVTAALTAFIHLKSQTERIGEYEEGYIIVPKKRQRRTLI